MKAITLFFILHLHATHLISSVWSTKGTQIFDTPRAQTPTYAFYMQGPILSSPQDKHVLSFSD